MAALTKGVALTFGLLSASVSVHNAIEDKSSSGNKQLCVGGTPGHPEHPPALVKSQRVCSTDGSQVAYTDIVKGRPEGDGYVIITSEEVEEARVDSKALLKRAGLTPHPAEQVEDSTVPGEKLYYLTPDPGAEASYAALRHLVQTHPEYAFMALWTPRSRAGQFMLKVRSGVLALQERVRQENVRIAPAVNAEAPEPMLAMADQVLGLEGIVSDYDPTTYEDSFDAKIRDIIATKTVVPGQTAIDVPGVTTPSTAVAGMDALAAMLANAKESGRKPAKKAAAKRTTTKKAS